MRRQTPNLRASPRVYGKSTLHSDDDASFDSLAGGLCLDHSIFRHLSGFLLVLVGMAKVFSRYSYD
jgi:hypothetical protein